MNYFDTLNADERVKRWHELAMSMPYLHRIWDLVSKAVQGTYALSMVFLNGHTFGLGDGIHDGGRVDAYTFLVYITPDWDPAWGGETIVLHRSDRRHCRGCSPQAWPARVL